MSKILCETHKKRVFVNADTGSVRHRENLESCDTPGIQVMPGILMPTEKFVWLCDTRMPKHYQPDPICTTLEFKHVCPHDKPSLGHCGWTACPNYRSNCAAHSRRV